MDSICVLRANLLYQKARFWGSHFWGDEASKGMAVSSSFIFYPYFLSTVYPRRHDALIYYTLKSSKSHKPHINSNMGVLFFRHDCVPARHIYLKKSSATPEMVRFRTSYDPIHLIPYTPMPPRPPNQCNI